MRTTLLKEPSLSREAVARPAHANRLRKTNYLRQGQIEILDYRQWYTTSGKFDANRVLTGWVERHETARQRGYEGLRLTELKKEINALCVESGQPPRYQLDFMEPPT